MTAKLISRVGAEWYWRVRIGDKTYEGIEPTFRLAVVAQHAAARTGERR